MPQSHATLKFMAFREVSNVKIWNECEKFQVVDFMRSENYLV